MMFATISFLIYALTTVVEFDLLMRQIFCYSHINKFDLDFTVHVEINRLLLNMILYKIFVIHVFTCIYIHVYKTKTF